MAIAMEITEITLSHKIINQGMTDSSTQNKNFKFSERVLEDWPDYYLANFGMLELILMFRMIL